MADQVQLRGGTTAEHATFTGASREVTVDTTKKTLVVHDGATAGGTPMLKEAAIGVTVQAYDADIPTVSATQSEMEAGTEAALRSMSPLNVKQTLRGAINITAAGNVGIGTTGPASKLVVMGDANIGKNVLDNTTAGVMLSAGGEASIVQTTAGSRQQCLFLNRQDTDGTAVLLRRSNGTVGTISVTAYATAYNTSSDYRLKSDIAPMTGALAKVALLKPCTYKWRVDGSDGQGFIAHELQAVVPQCVTGTKDATRIEQFEISAGVMGEREVPEYQGVDTSFLVATLTAALQELTAKVEMLEAKLGA